MGIHANSARDPNIAEGVTAHVVQPILLVCASVIFSPFSPLEALEVAETGPLTRALSLVPAMGTSAVRSARTHHYRMYYTHNFNKNLYTSARH